MMIRHTQEDCEAVEAEGPPAKDLIPVAQPKQVPLFK